MIGDIFQDFQSTSWLPPVSFLCPTFHIHLKYPWKMIELMKSKAIEWSKLVLRIFRRYCNIILIYSSASENVSVALQHVELDRFRPIFSNMHCCSDLVFLAHACKCTISISYARDDQASFSRSHPKFTSSRRRWKLRSKCSQYLLLGNQTEVFGVVVPVPQREQSR